MTKRYEPRPMGSVWGVWDNHTQTFDRRYLCINPMEAQVIAKLQNKELALGEREAAGPARNEEEGGWMAKRTDRSSQFLQWAHETFGDVALDTRERTMRFVEEAIELAHAMGLDAVLLLVLVDRVYSRPPGERGREFGQCLATFELLARVVGVDADKEATAELARVKAIPKEEWARRHGAKIALGIAQ